MAQTHVLFAKQPIFDARLKVAAYELLFRSDEHQGALVLDGDKATSHVLLHAFGHHKIDDIIGTAPAFINFTRNLLVLPPPLPPDKLVIEVLEDVQPDEQVLAGIKQLKRQGYKIALDDFFINPSTKKLLAYADIIKIDVLNLSAEKVIQYVNFLKPLKIELLAEKIETYEMMETCKALGFSLFQGYFLSKPHLVRGVKIKENKQTVLRLLASLSNPEVEIKALATIIATDPQLSYRVLRLVNSSAINTRVKIQSLTQAVSLLGINLIRQWAMLLMLSSDETKPMELCVLGMTRAKFGEQIGQHLSGKQLADECFTTGILSTFDAFLDIPMEQLITRLTLSPPIEQALTYKQGNVGEILQMTLNYEQANWQQVEQQLGGGAFKNIDEILINDFYTEAVSWARKMVYEL